MASLKALEDMENRKNGVLHVCDDARQFHSQRKKIEKSAYFKWRNAGCPQGDGKEFWLSAEQEICGAISQLVR